jgi:hypothetical protein
MAAYPGTAARALQLRALLESELREAEERHLREVALLKIVHAGHTGESTIQSRTIELTTAQTTGFLSEFLPELAAAIATS